MPRELREIAVISATATAKERFIRGLLRKGIGTRVIEDKAGGMAIEGINARGGYQSLDATRAGHLGGSGRCYRDGRVVRELMEGVHRGVRDWEGKARKRYLAARARALLDVPTEWGKTRLNQALQSLKAILRAKADTDYE